MIYVIDPYKNFLVKEPGEWSVRLDFKVPVKSTLNKGEGSALRHEYFRLLLTLHNILKNLLRKSELIPILDTPFRSL